MWLGSRTCRGECEPLRSQCCSPSSSCPPRRGRPRPARARSATAWWPASASPRWRRRAPATRWSSTPPATASPPSAAPWSCAARPRCAPACRVRVNALRMKGTKIELLYAHNGGEWLARFSKPQGPRSAARQGREPLDGLAAPGAPPTSAIAACRPEQREGDSGDRSRRSPRRHPDRPRVPHVPRSGGGGCAVPDAGLRQLLPAHGPRLDRRRRHLLRRPSRRPRGLELRRQLPRHHLHPTARVRSATPMVHNSMVIQTGGPTATLTGGSATQPQSLVSTGDSGSWYWPGASAVEDGALVQFLLKTRRTGSGLWDFAYDGSFMATYSLPGLSLQSVVPVPASDTIQLGDLGPRRRRLHLHLRHRGPRLGQVRSRRPGCRPAPSGSWQYYTGSDLVPGSRQLSTRDGRRLEPAQRREDGQRLPAHQPGAAWPARSTPTASPPRSGRSRPEGALHHSELGSQTPTPTTLSPTRS